MGVGLTVVGFLIIVMQGVFCKNWDLKLPKNIVSISGSCVTVPCHFTIPNAYEASILNCTDSGLWKKRDMYGPVVFNSSNPSTNVIQGIMLGNLTKKNCTTVFDGFPEGHNETYFFRLECPNNLKFSFTNGVNIDIKQALPPPLLLFRDQIAEGSQVNLLCLVIVPCSIMPPSLTWLPRDSSRQEVTRIIQGVDGEMLMESNLFFTASADNHNQVITCSVSYPLSSGGSTEPSATAERLNILYAPRLTTATLSPTGPLSVGRAVMFACSSDANPPVSQYTWYRNESGDLTEMGQGETFVLQISQGHLGLYLCEARNVRGSQRSRPVFLEATEGSSVNLTPYIICAVVSVLYILTLVVYLYKYQSLSSRLKKIEQKDEHIYTDLDTLKVGSDYDQLQLKTKPAPQVPVYENSNNLQTSQTGEQRLD